MRIWSSPIAQQCVYNMDINLSIHGSSLVKMHTYTRGEIYVCVCIQYDIMSMSSFWGKISLKIVLFSYIWHDHISLHDTSVKCPSDRNALFLFHMNSNNVDDWDANGSDRLFSTLRKWKQTGRSYVALQSTYRIIKIAIYIGHDRSCCILDVQAVIPLVIFQDILEVYCSFLWLISIDVCIQTCLKMKGDQNCLESSSSIDDENWKGNHHPWQHQHSAERMIVKRRKRMGKRDEEKESLQPSAHQLMTYRINKHCVM
jgi:hypothetical protein